MAIETRSVEKEVADLQAAKEVVLQRMKEMIKAGTGDDKKVEAFDKSVSDFVNMTRLSIVKDGGLDLSKVRGIAGSLEQSLKESSDTMHSEASKEAKGSSWFTISKNLSSTNLTELANNISNAENKLTYVDADISNAQVLGAESMAKNFADQGKSPVELPADGGIRSK